MADKLDPNDIKEYAELVKHLADKIPCYRWPGGCHMDDELNDEECTERGCILLRLYREGYAAGREHERSLRGRTTN